MSCHCTTSRARTHRSRLAADRYFVPDILVQSARLYGLEAAAASCGQSEAGATRDWERARADYVAEVQAQAVRLEEQASVLAAAGARRTRADHLFRRVRSAGRATCVGR